MKQLHLRNKQRDRRLNTKELRSATVLLLEDLLQVRSYDLAIHFIPAPEMAGINKRFLNHEGSTDVITFDYSSGYEDRETPSAELAGEVFISVADALTQSSEFKRPWDEEVLRYIVHGVLHLRGYDDLEPAARRKMKLVENRFVRALVAKLGPHGRTC